MTSFSRQVRADVPHGTPIEPPTLKEWTAAHQEPDAHRRRVKLALLHDRLVASSMRPWAARLYLLRHGVWMGVLVAVGLLLAGLNPWVYVPLLVGLPLVALAKAWRRTGHGD